MTTRPTAVKCPWCGAQETEPCTTQPGPGKNKKLFNREPLRLAVAHPSRIAAAMRLDGAGEGEIERALAGHQQAAMSKYREQPGCAPLPPPPASAKQPPQPPPDDPPADATARAIDTSAGTP